MAMAEPQPEVTMICVDNSAFMCGTYGGAGLMKAQTEAIEVYFREKLKAHPHNLVGFTTMGPCRSYCEPTRDPKVFKSAFKDLDLSGPLKLERCLSLATFGLNSCSLPKRRLVMFAGGIIYATMAHMKDLATLIRKNNITAVDVVNFGLQGWKNGLLQAFVDALGNDIGRYLYAPTGSHKSLALNLSSSPIIPRVVTPAAFEEDDEPLGIDFLLLSHKRKNINRQKYKNSFRPLVKHSYDGLRFMGLISAY